MRLVCPNCGAQYSVDASVIPEAGRDVQCSNCGHTWFQEPEGGLQETSAATRIASQSAPRREPPPPPSPPPTTGEAPAPAPAPSAPSSDATSPDATPGEAARPRRALDAAVMDVLREEAQREKAARAAEAPASPPPPGDGAPEPGPAQDEPQPQPQAERPPEQAVVAPVPPDERAIQAEEHKARMRGENPAAAVAALSGRAAQRREMLPDIEEINSTLRASADPTRTREEIGAEALERERRRSRRGFRLGFGTVALIAAALTLLYTHGTRLSAAVPELDQPISRYIAAVNDGRRWLDTTLRSIGGSD